MDALTTISTVTSTLKGAAETVKILRGLRGGAAVEGKVSELQGQIANALAEAVSAYQAQLAQLGKIQQLEGIIRTFEIWEREKQRYVLNKLPPGVFVYSLKPEMSDGEQSHYICQTCYQRGKKSILSSDEQRNGIYHLKCHECETVLQVGIFIRPPDPLSDYNPYAK